MNQENKKYLIHIEIMRIIAIFFVIFNHTSTRGFFLFSQYPDSDPRYWLYMMISVFCKFSVPLFLMLSGALLLGRKESIGYIWKKRILKLVLTLLVFSFFSYLQAVYQGEAVFSAWEFIKVLYMGNWNFSYWYLYVYIAYLVALPFLRNLCVDITKSQMFYLIGTGIFFSGILPAVQYLLWNGSISMNALIIPNWIIVESVLYPILGYCLERWNCEDFVNKGKKRIFIGGLWGAVIITILFSCYLTNLQVQRTGVCNEGTSQGFFSCFVIVSSMAIYITIKELFLHVHMPVRLERAIISIGKSSFAIYLVHVMVLKWKKYALVDWLDWIKDELHMNYMLAAILFSFFVMLISYIITLLIKKIPVLKMLV